MQFHLSFTPTPFQFKINHQHKLFLIGSCFTEQIGNKLTASKFETLENPNGILFNPISISTALQNYILNKKYNKDDLFFANECWNSWQHHSRFSNPSQSECLNNINNTQNNAHHFLKDTDWMIITLGSAFVYELENGEIAANCHKVPTDKFNKKLLTCNDVVNNLKETLNKLKIFNPKLKIIFTISPVRHLRDGFIENNRSKAILITAIHQLLNDFTFYFPAYELVIDDLRDYRFFAEDMVHPNYSATNYVWQKFLSSCIDESSQQLMLKINEINAAINHKPFNPFSDAHKKFKLKYYQICLQLKENYQYINLNNEIKYFS